MFDYADDVLLFVGDLDACVDEVFTLCSGKSIPWEEFMCVSVANENLVDLFISVVEQGLPFDSTVRRLVRSSHDDLQSGCRYKLMGGHGS